MEKLKFWLDELDLIAKEFNREYEQLCKEHLTRLQKINMELDEGSPEHIFACEYYYNLLDNRLETMDNPWFLKEIKDLRKKLEETEKRCDDLEEKLKHVLHNE